MRCPCIRCKDRVAGSKDGPSCHGSCEKYKEWLDVFHAKKAEEKLGRDIDAMVAAVARKRMAYLAADKRRRKKR